MTWAHIKHFLLGLLIVSSLFLSYGLWTASGGNMDDTEGSPRTTQPVRTSFLERDIQEVFSPNQYVIHRDNEIQIAESENIQDDLMNLLMETNFDTVDSFQRLGKSRYQELIEMNNGLEYVYNDILPLGLFRSTQSDLTNEVASQTFNRVWMAFDQPQRLYFYDSVREYMITVEVDELPIAEISTLLEDEDTQTVEAISLELENQTIYLPNETRTLPRQNYMIERLSPQIYLGLFFDNTAEVTPRQTGSIVRYIDLTTEVQYNQSNQTLIYTRERSDLGEWSITNRFEENYTQFIDVENWMELARYHGYDADLQRFTFRRYIGGIPVFSEVGQDIVELSVVESGMRYLSLPLRIVQTPITIRNQERFEMSPGEELINKIEVSPSLEWESIENIQLGYQWNYVGNEDNTIDGNVVEFIPRWYFQRDGTWINAERYFELEEGGAQ